MAAGARICVGQLGAPHGVRGEMRLRSFTADPQAVADYGPFETEDGRVIAIEALRPAKDHFVATLSGIRDRNAAERLVNAKLFVPRDQLPEIREEGEFYHADLVGLRAISPAGEKLGTVIAVHNFGAGDLIEVRFDATDKTEFVAFNETNVPAVDLGAGQIVIQPSPVAPESSDANPMPSRRDRA